MTIDDAGIVDTTPKGEVNKTEMCFCPSYYDENNALKDCTCGKCGTVKTHRNTLRFLMLQYEYPYGYTGTIGVQEYAYFLDEENLKVIKVKVEKV